ncbi:MAG: PH domain-containing protein [Candidatus Pacebacteria bacterium]|nr:PH domain-containing protein [Candidatus Paceibacterota bacterium]MBP9851391.1 PH domain-containing protein [Candidatus Paceibacterota bacterium]
MDAHIEDQIIKKFHSHPLHYFSLYFVGIILIAVGIVWEWPVIILGVFIFLLAGVVRNATTFYLLDSGIARGYKLFSTHRKYMEYENIQNVEVSQTFFENIIGIGNLKFDTSGSDKIEVEFVAISNPYAIEKIIRQKMVSK